MSSYDLEIEIDPEELFLKELFMENDELPTASDENDGSGAAKFTVYHQPRQCI